MFRIDLDKIQDLLSLLPTLLAYASGYETAWFMWLLQRDEDTAQAFVGASPELAANEWYQDQRIEAK